MGSISSQIQLIDRMSGPLYNITSALSQVVDGMHDVDIATNRGFDGDTFDDARRSIDLANMELAEMANGINRATAEQEQLNAQVNNGTSAMGGLVGKVIALTTAIGVGFFAKQITGFMYEAASSLEATEAKFNTVFAGMTNEAQSFIDEFQELTPATESATRSMASGIQDLLVPMGFVRSEATALTGETMHLVGALTNFNSATKSADDVAAAFQSALTGEYQSLKALGIQVNDTIVKQEAVAIGLATTTDNVSAAAKAEALLSLAYKQSGDALAAYNEESLDTATRMGILRSSVTDTFAEAGQSLLPKINDFLILIQSNMGNIESVIYGLSSALGVVIGVASWLFEIVMGIGNFTTDNWGIIEPIILGIAAALGIYTGALIVQNGVMLAHNILQGITAANTAIQTAFNGAWSISTFTQTVAQQGLNAALLACPITWIVMGIIAIITIIYVAVGATNKFANTSISATGLIAGAFMVMVAYIQNKFILLWNVTADYINFFANVWNSPIDSVKILFLDLSLTVIDYVANMASAIENIINKIPGIEVDITSGLDSFRNKVEDMSLNVKSKAEWVEVASKMEYVDYTDSFNKGYDFGVGIVDKVDNIVSGGMFDSGMNNTSSIASGIDDIASNTADTADKLTTSESDLKYIRDLAERDTINRFTTAEIKITMNNNNNINKDLDIDGVVDRLTSEVNEAMSRTAEGVYA